MKERSIPGFSLWDLVWIFFLLGSLRAIFEPDVFLHLSIGRQIFETGAIPGGDPFSWSALGAPWYAHEWLAGSLLYRLFQAGGWQALILLRSLLVALLWSSFYLVARRAVSRPAAALLTLFLGVASGGMWLLRPYLFSHLGLLALLALLDRTTVPRKWWPLFALLFGLWSNLHGGFVLGLAVTAAHGLACFLNRSAAWSQGRQNRASGQTQENGPLREEVRNLQSRQHEKSVPPRNEPSSIQHALASFGPFLAGVAGSCLNPYGPALLWYPLGYLGNRFMSSQISEWQSTAFAEEPLFELVLLGTVLLLVWKRRKLGLFPVLLLFGGLHLSLTVVRHIPIFAILALPALTRLLPAASPGSLISRLDKNDRRMRGGPLAAVATLLLLAGLTLGWQPLPAGIRPGVYPVAAVAKLEDLGPGRRLFNFDGWGSYLIFRRQVPVFIDGRFDLYWGRVTGQYLTVTHPGSGRWAEVLSDLGVDTVLYPTPSALSEVLSLARGWTRIYRDPQASLFIRTGVEERE